MFKRLPNIVAVASVLFLSSGVNAMTFTLKFDNSPDGGVTAPIVGSGNFSFDGDRGNGSFSLSSLQNVSFLVFFNNGNMFNLADTEDPLTDVLAVISSVGQDRFLRFGNIHGNSTGGSNGAFDLYNPSNALLTFQPGISGGNLYFTNGYYGNYEATSSVPEVSTILLFGIGLIGLGLSRNRIRS